MMTKLKPKREFPLREKRLDKSVEMVTELSLLHQLNPAPAKTERMGKWYEVVIPIGKDHVAYLTMPEDTLGEIKMMWNSNYPYNKSK